MKEATIREIIAQSFASYRVVKIDVKIGKINNQPEKIRIEFDEEEEPPRYGDLGKFLEAVDLAVIEDGYGDLVEFTLKFLTSGGDKNDNPTLELTMVIDS